MLKASNSEFQNEWAVILGGSSGFGLAAAKKLSQHGMGICIVHRDRKGSMERIEQEFSLIRECASGFLAFNLDALAQEGRSKVLEDLALELAKGGRKVKLLLHSIAYGNLKALVSEDKHQSVIEDEDMARTVYSMGTSILTWTQELHARKLFAPTAQVLGLTSEGNAVAWRGYGAVSAAKAALESVCRSIAVEFAPFGIRCNILQPGVTDTPALRLIPGQEKMKAHAVERNPYRRLTEPSDVANVIYLLCRPEAAWINGDVIRVDGGEAISG